MKKINFFIVLIFCLFLIFSFNGCLILNYSSLVLGAGNLTGSGNGAGTSLLESMSASEAALYEKGPVDIPVEMTKNEPPDIRKIDIKISDGIMTITGEAGALNTNQVSKVIAFVSDVAGIDLGSQTIVTASDDGSFVLQIPVNVDDDVLFAGLTDNELYSTPFLRIAQDPNGFYIILTTNSDYVNSSQSIVSDQNGNYYLGLAESSSQRGFLRKNLDDTWVEFLLEGASTQVDHVTVYSGSKIAYLTNTGELVLMIPSSNALSLVKGEPVFVSTDSFEKSLTTLENYEADQTKITMTKDEDGVLINQFGSEANVKFVRTVSGSVIPIVRSEWYDEAYSALARNQKNLYVFVLYEEQYIFYKTDLSDNVVTAWGNRETIRDDLDYLGVNAVDASDDGILVAEIVNSNHQLQIVSWDENKGFIEISDPTIDSSQYVNPKISPDGKYIFTCRLSEDSSGHQLYYHKIGVDDSGTFTALTSDTSHSVCHEDVRSYSVDSYGVHFYYADADGSRPQHGIFPLGQLP